MKLTQTEKVAIYAAALQGAMISNTIVHSQCGNSYDPVESCINNAKQLIDALEAQGEQPNPHEPITD